ncbi:MAG TPA: hypothetical protein VE687_11510, partial [Stellaceae bacterium]|nr:hypothetical protein [Stellaceae bacterium]
PDTLATVKIGKISARAGGSAPKSNIAVRSEHDRSRSAEENDGIGRERRAQAAPIQAKDAEGTENEGDPRQDNAGKAEN